MALTGLGVQFAATLGYTHDILATAWIILRFFTILTNLAVMWIFLGLTIGEAHTERTVGGITLAIMLVGVVYALLLNGLLTLSGGALLADTLLHKVTPVLVPLWWLIFAHKGLLRKGDPLIWAIFPALYLPYALVRGHLDGISAYPFINVAKLGWLQVGVNCIAIAIGFVAAGYALVAIDRLMGRKGE